MASTFRGLLGEKLGMTQVFDENNRIVPVTVVKAGPCVVTQVRTPEVDGYSAVQLGFGEIDPRKVNKPEGGHFTKAGVTPRRHLVELRTEDAGTYTVGQELTADVFDGVAKVDVIGTSKGKGTAGVMKRHGFKGLGAGHGTQRKHRVAGFHRRLRDARPRVQGPADGRPHGPRAARRRCRSTCTRSTPSAGCCSSRAPSRARRGASLLVRSAVKGGPVGSDAQVTASIAPTDAHRPSGRRPHPGGGDLRQRDAARCALRRQRERLADAPGRRGPAGRRPPGHALDEDPRPGQRWWRQALPPEGHRPRPPGLDPRAAVRRRWHGPRPAAARLRRRRPRRR